MVGLLYDETLIVSAYPFFVAVPLAVLFGAVRRSVPSTGHNTEHKGEPLRTARVRQGFVFCRDMQWTNRDFDLGRGEPREHPRE